MVKAINPLDRIDLRRLRESIKWSLTELDDFRTTYMRMLRQYVGKHYGKNGADDKVPINMFRMGIDVYQRQVSARIPKILARTRDSSLRSEARELEIATDHTLSEIDFGYSHNRVTKDAMLMQGVMKVGITDSKLEDAEGVLHDAGQVFADHVVFTDWAFDMTASSFEQVDWCGNRYQLPYETVMESGIFNKNSIEGLQPNDGNDSIDEFGSSEDASDLQSGDSMLKRKYRDFVSLWDIWLPYDGLVVTILAEDKGNRRPLRIVEWEGPERGPYHLLNFSEVPGSVLPASPGSNLLDLHEALNRLVRKIIRQGERQKTVTVADGPSTHDGSADRISQTEDGQVIRTDHPDGVRELRYGGPDQVNLALCNIIRGWTSYVGGNLDVMAGLSQQAETLGQERLLRGASSEFTADLQDRVVQFTDRVVTDVAYYQYAHPTMRIDLKKKIEGTNYEVPFTWSPDRRKADFFSFHMNIEPFSMTPQTPADRLNLMNRVVNEVIMPSMQSGLMQQQGLEFRIEEYLKYIAKFADFEELQDLVHAGGVPLELIGGTPHEPRQAAVTTRHHVRENIQNGGTEQARDNALNQTLLTGNANMNPDQQQLAFNF